MEEFSLTSQFPFTLKANLPGDGTAEVKGKAGPIDTHNAVKTSFDEQLTLRHFDPLAAGFLDKSAGLSLLADVDSARGVGWWKLLTSSGTSTRNASNCGGCENQLPQADRYHLFDDSQYCR